jgi:hypothetical protein
MFVKVKSLTKPNEQLNVERAFRWPIGFVAFVGSVVTIHAGMVAGNMLPNGPLPVYILGAVFAVVSVLCFWPWQRTVRAPAACDEEADLASFHEAVRQLARFSMIQGAVLAVLGLLGIADARLWRLPPIICAAIGVVAVGAGIIALAVASNQRSVVGAYRMTKALLYVLVLLAALVPAAALVYAVVHG